MLAALGTTGTPYRNHMIARRALAAPPALGARSLRILAAQLHPPRVQHPPVPLPVAFLTPMHILADMTWPIRGGANTR